MKVFVWVFAMVLTTSVRAEEPVHSEYVCSAGCMNIYDACRKPNPDFRVLQVTYRGKTLAEAWSELSKRCKQENALTVSGWSVSSPGNCVSVTFATPANSCSGS